MKRILLILMILLFFNCATKDEKEKHFQPTILLKEIIKDERVKNIIWDFRLTNIEINRSGKQNKEYELFRNNLTDIELVQITECEVPLLRCIAFKTLVERDYVNIRKIFNRHLNDYDLVKGHYYDVLLSEPVKIFMLNQLSPYSNSKFKFSKEEFRKMQDENYK
ncbi:hypothetical protein [Flavobacterium turcicum]|uniref:Lipoprotein n=1 Tax=Flavobacterium turcicum TaxID=2764718 RepID=A0ABR7JG42_9FLAO|nr:hypothetical protein [Flavobacterium turcicum]MBC5863154.1 hypothetical protein [Flavobacterium turcicum]NHL01886.1 hypothetical protein [Flavobacterium turcicum]